MRLGEQAAARQNDAAAGETDCSHSKLDYSPGEENVIGLPLGEVSIWTVWGGSAAQIRGDRRCGRID